jgi:hypothetical protein
VKPAGRFTSAPRTHKVSLLALALLAVAYCSIAIVTSALTTRGPHSAGASSVPGEWLVDSNGGVFSMGGAPFYGSAGSQRLTAPVVGMAPTSNGGGYWEDASDGGIFAYGDAPFFGSMGGKHLNAPIVGMAATPDGKGYWEVASDGGIFSFGDANFYGSTGGLRLNAPIVGMETTSDGKGYWLVASDGGIFNYGDAGFFGSTGSIRLHQPVVGMAATPDGGGYWMAARDGGVFSFGDAPFYGATPALDLAPVSAITATPDGKGYWEAATDGAVYPHGDAASFGANGMSLSEPVVGAALSILSSPSSSSVPQGSMAAPAGFSASDKVLDDQFANLDNWNTYYGPGTRWNNEGNLPSPYSGGNQPDSNDMAFYSPTQDVLMSGGGVSLEATPNNQFSSQGYSWESGVLTSKNPLPSGGWYVQVRAQMPDTSAGFWPAIWALPSSSAQELDGFEGGWPGSSPNEQGHSDTFASSGQIQQVWSTPGGANVSSGYNTYGFQYIPGTGMRFYFNGTQVYSSSADLSTQSYYLFLQLQVASSGTSGWHTIGGSTPGSMQIAEVQVYS